MYIQLFFILINIYFTLGLIILVFLNNNLIPSLRYQRYSLPHGFRLLSLPVSGIRYWKFGAGSESVILLHGWTANSGMMVNRAKIYMKRGFTVYLLDAPSHGVNKTTFFPNTVQYARALDELILTDRITQPILHGVSFGSIAIVFAVSSRKVKAKALVLEALPSSMDRIFFDMMRYAHIPVPLFYWVGWISTESMRHYFLRTQTRFDLTSITVPIFLIHGQQDKMFPCQENFEKNKKLLNNLKKNFSSWEVGGSSHSEMDKNKEYPEKLNEFIDKVIGVNIIGATV